MTSTPAGWYDDGHGALRWFDGAQWTEHVQPAPSAPPVVSEDAAPQTGASAEAEATPTGEVAAPADDVGGSTDEVVATEPNVAPDAAPVAVDDVADPTEAGADPAAEAPVVPGFLPPVPPAPGGVPPMPPTPGSGGYTQTAAVLPPTAPTGRGWVLPVILGGAFLVLVILGIVFIPMLVQSFTASRYSADENGAIELVESYDEAWQEGDCDGYEAVTTENLRSAIGVADCATFEEASAGFQDATDNYEIDVQDVSTDAGVITVRTDETYTSFLDEDGNPVPGFDAISEVEYTVTQVDGQWLIDDTLYVE